MRMEPLASASGTARVVHLVTLAVQTALSGRRIAQKTDAQRQLGSHISISQSGLRDRDPGQHGEQPREIRDRRREIETDHQHPSVRRSGLPRSAGKRMSPRISAIAIIRNGANGTA